MTLKWTKTPPDRAGWWWTRFPMSRYVKVRRMRTGVIRLVRENGELRVQTDTGRWTHPLDTYFETKDREWAGPIPLPEEPDVDD